MSTSITSSTLGKKTYKIILLGDSGTGKTSIIERFVNNQFEQKENPTIGIDFVGKNITYKGTTCRLQLWDTAGQERFRSLIPSYLKDAICAIFVFDVANPDSLNNMHEWIDLFKNKKSDKAISIICGNKSDLEKNFDKKKLQAIMEKNKMPYHTISAKTGQNIENLFFSVVDLINKNNSKKQKKQQVEEQQIKTTKPLKPGQQSKQQQQKQKNVKITTQNVAKRRFYCC